MLVILGFTLLGSANIPFVFIHKNRFNAFAWGFCWALAYAKTIMLYT